MVQFPGFPFHTLWIQMWMAGLPTGRVTPFGYPRISGCVLLPAAFRSLPRPSSYDSSKASTMDPFSLDHILNHSLCLGEAPLLALHLGFGVGTLHGCPLIHRLAYCAEARQQTLTHARQPVINSRLAPLRASTPYLRHTAEARSFTLP